MRRSRGNRSKTSGALYSNHSNWASQPVDTLIEETKAKERQTVAKPGLHGDQ